MTKETIKILLHIIDARIDKAEDHAVRFALCNIRNIMEYAITDNIECLRQFDYLPTLKDQIEKNDDAAIATRKSASL